MSELEGDGARERGPVTVELGVEERRPRAQRLPEADLLPLHHVAHEVVALVSSGYGSPITSTVASTKAE